MKIKAEFSRKPDCPIEDTLEELASRLSEDICFALGYHSEKLVKREINETSGMEVRSVTVNIEETENENNPS